LTSDESYVTEFKMAEHVMILHGEYANYM